MDLSYSVKIAWIRTKPDLTRGRRLPEQLALECAISSWSLLEYLKSPVKELSALEAQRTYNLYKEKGTQTSLSPKQIFLGWLQDFHRFISPDHPTYPQYLTLAINCLSEVYGQTSSTLSLEFLDPWFTVVPATAVLQKPRDTLLALRGDKPTTNEGISFKRKDLNGVRPNPKRQKTHTTTPSGGESIKHSANSTASKAYEYLPRGPNMLYPKPAKYHGKTGNPWCSQCGYDHKDVNKHVFVNGLLDPEAMKMESVPRLNSADRLLRQSSTN